ncbi:MAG: hypothetical protein LGB53_03905 [Sulfurovum sp.]|nr:hypothetical protein [Sulfurovum sp.]
MGKVEFLLLLLIAWDYSETMTQQINQSAKPVKPVLKRMGGKKKKKKEKKNEKKKKRGWGRGRSGGSAEAGRESFQASLHVITDTEMGHTHTFNQYT